MVSPVKDFLAYQLEGVGNSFHTSSFSHFLGFFRSGISYFSNNSNNSNLSI